MPAATGLPVGSGRRRRSLLFPLIDRRQPCRGHDTANVARGCGVSRYSSDIKRDKPQPIGALSVSPSTIEMSGVFGTATSIGIALEASPAQLPEATGHR